jgi:hypothetical protein
VVPCAARSIRELKVFKFRLEDTNRVLNTNRDVDLDKNFTEVLIKTDCMILNS